MKNLMFEAKRGATENRHRKLHRDRRIRPGEDTNIGDVENVAGENPEGGM